MLKKEQRVDPPSHLCPRSTSLTRLCDLRQFSIRYIRISAFIAITFCYLQTTFRC